MTAVQVKNGDYFETVVKRAEEQREKDQAKKGLKAEKELLQLERQRRKVNSHYKANWDNTFQKAAVQEVDSIVENALIQQQLKGETDNNGEEKKRLEQEKKQKEKEKADKEKAEIEAANQKKLEEEKKKTTQMGSVLKSLVQEATQEQLVAPQDPIKLGGQKQDQMVPARKRNSHLPELTALPKE